MKKRFRVSIFAGMGFEQFREEECHEWDVYSFLRKHTNYVDRAPEGREYKGEGKSFFLSYYEHGACRWYLYRDACTSPWDTVSIAGVLIWKGNDAPYEERKKRAKQFLDRYNKWSNGYTYSVTVQNPNTCPHCGKDDPENEFSTWPLFGSEEVEEYIKGQVSPEDEVIICGPEAHRFQNLTQKAKV